MKTHTHIHTHRLSRSSFLFWSCRGPLPRPWFTRDWDKPFCQTMKEGGVNMSLLQQSNNSNQCVSKQKHSHPVVQCKVLIYSVLGWGWDLDRDVLNRALLSDDPCLKLMLSQQQGRDPSMGRESRASGATSVDASVGMPQLSPLPAAPSPPSSCTKQSHSWTTFTHHAFLSEDGHYVPVWWKAAADIRSLCHCSVWFGVGI